MIDLSSKEDDRHLVGAMYAILDAVSQHQMSRDEAMNAMSHIVAAAARDNEGELRRWLEPGAVEHYAREHCRETKAPGDIEADHSPVIRRSIAGHNAPIMRPSRAHHEPISGATPMPTKDAPPMPTDAAILTLSIQLPITISAHVVDIVRELIDRTRGRDGGDGVDHFTDGIAFGLYSLADDLRRQAHPEWPDLRPMLHELRLAVPEDIHPQARCFIDEWITEAEYAVMPKEATRLAGLATDKIADELRWNAQRTASRGRGSDQEVADYLKRAEVFDNWLSDHAVKEAA
jgi:hypothetical protein